MTSIGKNVTETGRTPEREATKRARSIAAPRRAEWAERRAALRRENVLITHGEDWRGCFGRARFGQIAFAPSGSGPNPHLKVDAAAADVFRRFDLPSDDDLGDDPVEGDGFAGEDVAIWHDGKILAVVRRGCDGKPEVSRFDAPEPTQDEGADRHDG